MPAQDEPHLLHEHPVVALCSHAGVGKAQDGPKPVHAEVALAAAALSAGGCRVLKGSNPWSAPCQGAQCNPLFTLFSSAITCGQSMHEFVILAPSGLALYAKEQALLRQMLGGHAFLPAARIAARSVLSSQVLNMSWKTYGLLLGAHHQIDTSIAGKAYLGVPGAEGLDGAAQDDDLPRDSWVHHDVIKAASRRPSVLHIVEAQVQADCARQKRQQSPLLQLVVQDGGVALSPVHFARQVSGKNMSVLAL